jgi:hypothetical protein
MRFAGYDPAAAPGAKGVVMELVDISIQVTSFGTFVWIDND